MEHPAGLTYLAVAYGGFFVLLAAFLLRLHRRGRALESEIEALEARTGGGSESRS